MAFKSNIIPLSTSIVAWDSFLKEVLELTGHSPSRIIDTSGNIFTEHAKYLILLENIRALNINNPLTLLTNSTFSLNHLMLGFLIVSPASIILRLTELTDLNIFSIKTKDKRRLAVCSGTLKQWKDTILILLTNEDDSELRHIGNICLNFMINIGLKPVFIHYNRKHLTDGTFLLENK